MKHRVYIRGCFKKSSVMNLFAHKFSFPFDKSTLHKDFQANNAIFNTELLTLVQKAKIPISKRKFLSSVHNPSRVSLAFGSCLRCPSATQFK